MKSKEQLIIDEITKVTFLSQVLTVFTVELIRSFVWVSVIIIALKISEII